MNNKPYAPPRWGDGARVQWYGERGIVNAVVAHISAASDFPVEVRKFLGAIIWADGSRPSWIDKVIDARLIVEIGLADFGNPDLMVICQTGEEVPFLVFVEAKAKPYEFSTGSNGNSGDAGFNSTINGQLALKYRFARALEASTNNDLDIAEPVELCAVYSDRKRRHLVKGEVRDILGECGLIGLPEDRCFYVAFTWDDEPSRVFDSTADRIPRFLSVDHVSLFESMSSRYGWLGYANLEKRLTLGIEYRNACHCMISSPLPSEKDYARWRRGTALGPEEMEIVDQIEAELVAACSNRRAVSHRSDHSVSIIVDRQTVAKIMLRDPVFVGIRDTLVEEVDRQRFPARCSIHGVAFHGFTLDLTRADLSANRDLSDLLNAVSRLYSAAT